MDHIKFKEGMLRYYSLVWADQVFISIPRDPPRFAQFQFNLCSSINNLKKMDTSNPAVFVNAELLRMYVGRKVRAVIQVIRNDGGSITGKSTDEQQLVVKGHPSSPPTTFVEVIGIAESNQSIKAEIWTNFGDNFDTASYNTVCQLANGDFKHLFI